MKGEATSSNGKRAVVRPAQQGEEVIQAMREYATVALGDDVIPAGGFH